MAKSLRRILLCMHVSYPRANPLVVSTQENRLTDSTTYRISSRIAPVCPTQRTKLTPRQRQSYLAISSNINTGPHSKWQAPVSKSKQLETLQDNSCDTAPLVSKSFLKGMLTSAILMIVL